MAPISFIVDAILFDMDGTLIDSTAGVVGAWEAFRETYPDIDVHNILSSAHGIRTVDNLKKYCGLTDPLELTNEAERFERAILTSSTENGRQGIILLPGAAKVLEELQPARHLPNPRWAICTSATRSYGTAALKVAGVPVPDVFVTADDVDQGKPFPDPYILGAKQCGVKAENCVVFEDAPSGIRSGIAAGCKTVALLTTHPKEQIEACQADYVVDDLSCISVRLLENGVEVNIN